MAVPETKIGIISHTRNATKLKLETHQRERESEYARDERRDNRTVTHERESHREI